MDGHTTLVEVTRTCENVRERVCCCHFSSLSTVFHTSLHYGVRWVARVRVLYVTKATAVHRVPDCEVMYPFFTVNLTTLSGIQAIKLKKTLNNKLGSTWKESAAL
jgi:hypothetical protein